MDGLTYVAETLFCGAAILSLVTALTFILGGDRRRTDVHLIARGVGVALLGMYYVICAAVSAPLLPSIFAQKSVWDAPNPLAGLLVMFLLALVAFSPPVIFFGRRAPE